MQGQQTVEPKYQQNSTTSVNFGKKVTKFLNKDFIKRKTAPSKVRHRK